MAQVRVVPPDSLKALRATELLDTPPELAFDRLTRLASGLLHAPVALVSLVDEARQFFKSAFGLAEPWASLRETPLSHSFCAHIVKENAPLVVDDARLHPLVHDNLAITELGVIAYAGVPLVVEGQPIGALCVAAGEPRAWTDAEVQLLRDLADSVVSEIELRVATKELREQQTLTDAMIESLGDGVMAITPDMHFAIANSTARRWFPGCEPGAPVPPDWAERFSCVLLDGTALAPADGVLGRALRGEPTNNLTFTVKSAAHNLPRWLEATGRTVRNAAGRFVAAVAVFRDVTERIRQAERNDQSLAAILDSMGEGLIVLDRERRIQRLNPMAEALTSWNASEAIGRPLDDVFALGTDGTLRARNGVEHAVAISVAPIIDPPAQPSGSVLLFRDMTAERAAQAALAASEAKYRALYENAPDMFMTTNLKTNLVLDCNRTLCETLGYAKDELVGQPFHRIYHDDFQVDPAAVETISKQDGRLEDVERRLRRKDGTSVTASMNVHGVRDERGELVATLGVWRDITRREQAEDDRAFLLALTEELHATTTLDVLERACAALRAYLGATHAFFAHEREIAPLAPSLLPIVIGDVTARGDVDAFLARGYAAVVAAPQLRDGAWAASLVVAFDGARAWEEREIDLIRLVGERVWMRAEHLRLIAERFRELVEGVPDHAIYMLDPGGRVATWNAGAERLTQYAAAEIIGESHARFYSAAETMQPAEVLDRARAEGRYEHEDLCVRKDGSTFWAETLLTPLSTPDGALDGFVKVVRDVTERKKRDEELARAHREREVLLQEVHHRVKNNLQIISSLINMQARKLEDGPARAALDQCRARVMTIALIHQSLYQSKDYGHVRFADYVRTLAGNVLRATGMSPSDVALELDIEDLPLSIDRALPCGLIVNELITNAVKHGFQLGIPGKLRVELKAKGDTTRLSVSDDGKGLPADFDVHTSRSLGMKLVATLAQQIGGELTVGREHGASFGVTFAS